MQFILALLLASSLIIGALAQSWVGNYTIDRTSCNTTRCCCFVGTLVVTQSNDTFELDYDMNGPLCNGINSTSIMTSAPVGYNKTHDKFAGGYLVFSLSSDSNTINLFDSNYTACPTTALRSNITMQTTSTVRSNTTVKTSDAEKHAISTMGVVAGIFLGMMSRMAHR